MCHETGMARTKKQTLVNACERRRQIQEEILRESLASKPKKESLSLTTENPETGSASASHNGVTAGKAASTLSQAEGSAGHSDISRDAASVLTDCSDPGSMSAWSPSCGPTSAPLTEENLPKAVICITDICRSPTKLTSDDHQDCKEAGVKSQGSVSKSSDGHHLKVRDNHSRRHNGSLRQQEETLSHEGVVTSLRSLRASSDKVRGEKSNRRTRSEHSSASCHTPHSRHSSGRQRSPATPVANQRKGNKGSRSPVEEKPKINIFTDSIGVDLGKRIRSPRRLSDDMIALPIFSARKWGNSPKEMSASSCGRSAEEASFVEGLEAGSTYNNVGCQSFKSPVVSPKKSSPVSLFVKASASSMGQSPLPDNQLSDVSLADSDCSSMSLYNGSQADPFDSESESCMSSSKALAGRICESMNSSHDAKKFKRVNQKSDRSDNSDGSLQPPSESDTRDSLQGSVGLAVRTKYANNDKLRSKTQESPQKSDLKAEISSFEVKKCCENVCLSQKYDCGVSDRIETPMEIDCGSKCDEERKVIKDSCNSSLNNSSGEEIKCENSCSGHLSISSQPDKDEKPQSSLLCAMLIGGTEVAHSYNRERMKTQPHSMESSDSDLDNCKHKMEYQASRDAVSKQHDDVSMVKLDLTSTAKNKEVLLVEVKTEKPDEQFDACGFIHSADQTCNNKQVKSEQDELINASYNLKTRRKRSPLNLTSQLKKLNEDVFKLLEIGGVEGPQQNETRGEESVDKKPCESKPCEQKCEMELPETALYSLISTLGNRLKGSSSNTDCSAPEVTIVDKLMESCPKNALSVFPKIKTKTSQIHTNFFKDLKENEKEDIKDESMHSLKMSSSPEKKESLTSSSKGQKHFVLDSECRKDTLSSTDLLLVPTNKLTPSSCPQEKDFCDIKSTFLVACGNFDIQNENGPSESHGDKKFPCDVIDRSQVLESGSRHSFQKSKTCDDFNDRLCSDPVINEKTLRRVNSSPQINIKSLISHVSPSSPSIGCSKDIQNKSKLGSRIPIPGTSYYTKSRKTWRIPRVVMEPKPLSVLSTLEDKSSLPSNIFTCQNLQKYLNIPSNRIIMTPERMEEMKMLDAQAKQADEMIDKIKMERDENIKKMDEEREMNADFVRFEPDFDEVDGFLFMSFSSEIELQAHVKVEKALQWDRDDTMLKVSQAKAFEEAKALNEDMGHFKLKHLRGQHMRWKKYRRLYTSEVKSLLAVYSDLKSHGDSLSPKKTSDVSKIKGWKKKLALAVEADTSWLSEFPNASSNDIEDDLKFFGDMGVSEDDMNCLNESFEEGDKSRESRRAKRLLAFSRQKEHRQLFRELKMDWEDRMIHRKLGGWSLKGNRPVAFSSAAKKRKEKMSKEIEPVCAENKETNPVSFLFEEAEAELSEMKDTNDYTKKKKPVRIFYPLLTEKMARNAVKAIKPLETENTSRPRPSRKKARQDRSRPVRLPSLTPVEPMKPRVGDFQKEVKNISPATSLSTPSASASMRTLHSSSGSAGTATQEADMQDEPVMEGVDIASENISSPSVTDTSSIKSCSKPGCRYGCICHLCSVSETSVPQPNPVTKQPRPVCDKEYCRLGCICDSLDSDKSVSEKDHCRRPSCMLECVCPESGSLYGNDDIPYLPSMKRRPKPGDRFSNLPQREKTHRTAKNLDAVTRKAMMLYETSEIYCERVERSKKRIEAEAGGSMAGADDLFHTSAASNAQVYCDIEIVGEERPPQTISLLEGDVPVVSVAPAYSSSSSVVSTTGFQQIQHQPKTPAMRMAGTAFVFNDVRHIVASMEPSAHKRKRKSHPLSDEIFTSSSCARAQPFRYTPVPKEAPTTNTSVTPASVSEASCLTFRPSLPMTPVPCPPSTANNETSSALPIITSVQTLAPTQGTDSHQGESGQNEPSLASPAKTCASALGAYQGSSTSQPKTVTNVSTSSVTPASSRQFHGWHKSMVCLKARAPPSSQDLGEDDVKEEDEVKLLEFAANCNWEGAKREILAKVAQCLTRGQYPQPRTMNVCEFVVEILPKAHHPSQIPPELRAKLPGQMYSIRVRITRREPVRRMDDDSDVIDLSVSPVKSCDATSPTEDVNGNASDPSFKVAPSVGISGLRKYFITNSNGQQTLTNGKENLQFQGVAAVSASTSRRASTESLLAKNFLEDPKKSLEPAVLNVMTPPSVEPKPKSPSFLHLATGSNVPASSSASVITTPAGSGGSKKMTARPVKTQSLLTKQVPQVPAGVAPIFGPFNDVRYMIPGKDGTMQVIEMGARLDKNKKLIAVPITVSKTVELKGKQSGVVGPVSGIGQKRMVPLLSPQGVTGQLKNPAGQPMLIRLPGTSPPTPLVPGVRQPVVLQPMKNSIKGQPQRFQVVPLQLGNCMAMSHAKVISAQTAHGFKSVAATTGASKQSNSCNEKTIDGVPTQSNAPISSQASTSSVDTGQLSDKLEYSIVVTDINGEPFLSPEPSPGKHHPKKFRSNLSDPCELLQPKESPEIGQDAIADFSDTTSKVEGVNLVKEEVIDTALYDTSANIFFSDSHPLSENMCSKDEISIPVSNLKDVIDESPNTQVVNDLLAVKEEILTEMELGSNVPFESAIVKTCDSPIPSANINDTERRPIIETILTGSKRQGVLEEPLSVCPRKKPCLVSENASLLDEDSLVSLNSNFSQQQPVVSPLSSIDRPKSVMSSALSTGSSDDLFVLMSSDEEVDVGEDERPDEIISYRMRAERALENDHGYLNYKSDQSNPEQREGANAKTKEDRHDEALRLPEKGRSGGRNFQRAIHHNQLERLRRSRMRLLFDDLQKQVLQEMSLPKEYLMSKVKVLVEAKSVILSLNQEVREGGELIHKLERQHKALLKQLTILKGGRKTPDKDVAPPAPVFMKKAASEKSTARSRETPETSLVPEMNHGLSSSSSTPITLGENQEIVNLVSPSTEEDKSAEEQDADMPPVYEDISDPEDGPTHRSFAAIRNVEDTPQQSDAHFLVENVFSL